MEKRCRYFRIAVNGQIPAVGCSRGYQVEEINGNMVVDPQCLDRIGGFTDGNCLEIKERPDMSPFIKAPEQSVLLG
jgi:hypothetical protein